MSKDNQQQDQEALTKLLRDLDEVFKENASIEFSTSGFGRYLKDRIQSIEKSNDKQTDYLKMWEGLSVKIRNHEDVINEAEVQRQVLERLNSYINQQFPGQIKVVEPEKLSPAARPLTKMKEFEALISGLDEIFKDEGARIKFSSSHFGKNLSNDIGVLEGAKDKQQTYLKIRNNLSEDLGGNYDIGDNIKTKKLVLEKFDSYIKSQFPEIEVGLVKAQEPQKTEPVIPSPPKVEEKPKESPAQQPQKPNFDQETRVRKSLLDNLLDMGKDQKLGQTIGNNNAREFKKLVDELGAVVDQPDQFKAKTTAITNWCQDRINNKPKDKTTSWEKVKKFCLEAVNSITHYKEKKQEKFEGVYKTVKEGMSHVERLEQQRSQPQNKGRSV